MSLPLDLLVLFVLGAVAGSYASRAVGPHGPFVNRVLVGLVASVAVFVIPPALIRFHFWNDWTWLYLLSPTSHPGMSRLPAEAANVSLFFLSALAGYRLTLRTASAIFRALTIAIPLALLVVSATVLRDRVFVFSRFDDFVAGRAVPIIETPWAFVMFAVEIAAIIATVAVVRRLAELANAATVRSRSR